MSFLRIKPITKNGKTFCYLVKQTNVRKGKKVRSIIEHMRVRHGLCLSWPAGFSGDRSTDKRQIKHQEMSDRALFTNRAAFNVKHGQDYQREQKARDAAKPAEKLR